MPVTPLYEDTGGGVKSHAPQAVISKFIENNWNPALMPLYHTTKEEIFFSHTIMPETSMRIVIHCDVDPSRITDFEIGGRVQFYTQRVVVHAYVSDTDALKESITSDVAEEIATYLRDFITDNRQTLQYLGIDWIEKEGDGWAPNPEDKETQHYYLYVRVNYYADATGGEGGGAHPASLYNPQVFKSSVFQTGDGGGGGGED